MPLEEEALPGLGRILNHVLFFYGAPEAIGQQTASRFNATLPVYIYIQRPISVGFPVLYDAAMFLRFAKTSREDRFYEKRSSNSFQGDPRQARSKVALSDVRSANRRPPIHRREPLPVEHRRIIPRCA